MAGILRPNPYDLAPMLPLLPQLGQASELSRLSGALFARFERVREARRELSKSSGEPGREVQRRLLAEEQMLRTVLEWLKIRPEDAAE